MNTSHHKLVSTATQIEQEKTLPLSLKEPSALLTFLWALGIIDWPAAIRLITLLPKQYPDLTPIWGGLFAHLLRLAPDTETAKKHQTALLDKIISDQLQLQQRLDSEETGLFSSPSETTTSSLVLQTYWIWSTLALVDIGNEEDERILQLLLLNELYVFEINEQLWQTTERKYTQAGVLQHNTEGFLPLFATIPDQDQAEEMYLEMIAQGFPLRKEEEMTDIPAVALANIFVLYVGLLEYSMQSAAESLKLAYARKASDATLAQEVAAVLWEKY